MHLSAAAEHRRGAGTPLLGLPSCLPSCRQILAARYTLLGPQPGRTVQVLVIIEPAKVRSSGRFLMALMSVPGRFHFLFSQLTRVSHDLR